MHRRAGDLTPELARAVLAAFHVIAGQVPEARLARMIAEGALESLYTEMLAQAAAAGAYAPVQEALRRGLARETRAAAHRLPPRYQPASVGIGFDILNPDIITAIRTMETRVLARLSEGVRGAVRAHVELGLRAGVNPRTIARGLRDVVPLAPNQVNAVANFRAMLEGGEREALTRALRDRRFDATLRRALGEGGTGLSKPQIDRMADAYRRRMIAFNAETQARTAALESVKLGQRLSWQDAIDRGVVDTRDLMKRCVTVLDGRERPEHHDMNGDVAPFEGAYRNGDTYAGEGDPWNCRCADYVFVGRAGAA